MKKGVAKLSINSYSVKNFRNNVNSSKSSLFVSSTRSSIILGIPNTKPQANAFFTPKKGVGVAVSCL